MAKNHGENCHWSSPTPSPEAPKTFQNRGGGTHESPDATKSVQKACKRCPRDVQVLLKTGQKRRKCGQDAPKTGLGGTQTPPPTNPTSLKTHIGHDRHRQPPSPGCRNVFFTICCIARAACEVCSDPLKLWFCYMQSISTTQARMHAKTTQIMSWSIPKSPREPAQIHQKSTTNRQKSSQNGTMA